MHSIPAQSVIIGSLCAFSATGFCSKQSETIVERKTMIQNESSQLNQSWIDHINETGPCKGSLTATDKTGALVQLEWFKAGLMSPEFARAMQGISDIGVDAFVPVELDFLRAFPQVVGAEPYFKQFEPLFKEGQPVDWDAVEQLMRSVLIPHFQYDSSKISSEMLKVFAKDQCIFVSVKDQETDALIGYISFHIKPDFPFGTLKVSNFAVKAEYQNRGLAKLLISSVFKIVPATQRIFLCTRITNDKALQAYRSWGFALDKNPVQYPPFNYNLEHWIFMEYDAQTSDTLQKLAENIA